jgi:hypothetical protein
MLVVKQFVFSYAVFSEQALALFANIKKWQILSKLDFNLPCFLINV